MESQISAFFEFCISASDESLEVNNPIKITAIITLVGTDEGLKAVIHLLFELFEFLNFLSLRMMHFYQILYLSF